MRTTHTLLLAAAAALLAVATPAAAQRHGRQALDSAALVKRFPEALVYEGIARAREKDYTGAIAVWEEFVSKSDSAAAERVRDRAQVRTLIAEARRRIRSEAVAKAR